MVYFDEQNREIGSDKGNEKLRSRVKWIERKCRRKRNPKEERQRERKRRHKGRRWDRSDRTHRKIVGITRLNG